MIERDGQTLRLSGALTLAGIPKLAEEGKSQIADGDVIDLSAVTEVDSTALSLIFEWQRSAQSRGVHIAFKNLPASLISLAMLYGVSDMIKESAVAA